MESEYKNILIAIDGSNVSKKAFMKSIEIAKKHDAHLTVTYIVDTKSFSTVEPYDSAIYSRSEANGNVMLDEHLAIANEAGFFNINKLLKMGSPKGTITKEIIPDEEIDLVILGATGAGAVERFLMGSVSSSVIHHAKCDVLIVR